jgi:Xaa-Pro aminopeptidase
LNIELDEMMRADFAFLLQEHLNAPTHRFSGDTVGELRAVNTPEELKALRDGAQLNDGAFQIAFDALRTGMTEIELRDIIVAHYKANGAEPAFCIVAFGVNSAFPHHHTGNDVLKPGIAGLIDSECRLNGYPSDMTRCAGYGETPDPKYDQIAGSFEQAVQAAHAAALPGVPCQGGDVAARGVITDAGFGDAFTHRTGHGLGVDVHESPYVTATNAAALALGNIFSIEPGIYLQGTFGIRWKTWCSCIRTTQKSSLPCPGPCCRYLPTTEGCI